MRVVKIDTLLTFNGPAKDWDKDGKPEYNGAYDFSQQWEDKKGKMRTSYDPILYYEATPTGLVLDSVLTEQKVRAQYGVFMGYNTSEHPGVLIDKLPKSRISHP